MVWDSFNNNQTPSTFNYGTEAEKIKRRRALAQALGESAMQQERGQMVPGGPNGFYVAPSPFAPLSKMLTAYLSKKGMDDADTAQRNLDDKSREELARQLEHLYDGKQETVQGTPAQDAGGVPALTPEELGPTQLETIRDPVQQPKAQEPTVVSPSVRATLTKSLAGESTNNTGLTPQQIERAALAKQLTSQEDIGLALDAARAEKSAAYDRFYSYGSVQKQRDPKGWAEAQDSFARATRKVDELEKQWASSITPEQASGRAPLPMGKSSGGATGSWGEPAAAQTAPAAPQIALAAPPQQQPAPTPAQAPAAAAQAPASAAGYMPAIPSTPDMVIEVPPSQAEMVSRLAALAQTGPVGAQMATAQMNSLFASKNGRFNTSVHADPVNGGFIQVVTDTQTGRTQINPIAAAGAGEKVLETKDTPAGIMERTAKGWRLARDGEGNVVGGKEAQDTREKQAKTGAELDAQIQAGEDLKKSLNALTRIDPKTGKPAIDAASGLGGRLSLLYNTITRDPTRASQAQAEIDGLKSKLFNYGMAKIKAAGGGAGAANSDVEGKRIEANLGNLDIGVLGTEGFIRKANEIIADIDSRAELIDRMAAHQGATLQTRQPGSAPVRFNYEAFKAGR